MPSYPSDIWDCDDKAWRHLEAQGFRQHNGVISPPARFQQFNHETAEAINYLCGEWDWAYEPKGPDHA